jgi:hypothetical protein
VAYLHKGAALGLFACLIAMMFFFSSRAKSKGKLERAIIYRSVAVLMGSGIVIGFVIGDLILKIETTLFWVEFWALTLFGIGWLVAGAYHSEDENEQSSEGNGQPV